MNGARLVGRGLHDTFENLIGFVLATMVWWACLILVVPVPSVAMALFVHADPRHGTLSDRPTWSETLRSIVQNLGRAWKLTLMTVPVVLLLVYNIVYYFNDPDTVLGVLAPLWCVLFVFSIAVTATAFSLAALEGLDATTSVKVAAIMVGARIPEVIVMMLLLGIVVAIGTILVIPTALFLPMTVAATFNRFVLTTRRIAIPDPLAPTDERLAEGKPSRRKFWGP